MIRINNKVLIEEDQLVFKFSRSRGPGGQNVNKVNTRVTVYFDVAGCSTFTDIQKKQILLHLKTRADKTGVIRIVCQKHRTQKANRIAAIERLIELLREALKTRRKRKKTTVPRSAVEKRLKQKKHHSLLKRQRVRPKFCE